MSNNICVSTLLLELLTLSSVLITTIKANSQSHTSNTHGEDFQQTVHQSFSKRELKQIFGAETHDQVPSYDVVEVTAVDHRAKLHSRVRRSLHDHLPIFLYFKADGLVFHLNVTLNKKLVPENNLVEFHNGKTVRRLKGMRNTFSTGKVVSDPESLVTLDHQAGVSGLIHTNDEMYMISPIPKRIVKKTDDPNSHGNHIIFKRSALPHTHPESVCRCGVKDPIQNIRSALGRQRRATIAVAQKEKTLELLIAGDKSLVGYHGKDIVPAYLLAQANMAAGAYQDTSLAYPITVAVTRIVVFENDIFPNTTGLSHLLSKWREWNFENNPEDDSDPLHADNAVLVSRYGTGGLSGLAYTGMCDRRSSQSVDDDRGLMTGLTVAHELGHNLGLYHDGGAECPDGNNIMSSSSVNGYKAFEWSKCSSSRLQAQLLGPQSACLNDKPTKVLNTVAFQLYGQVYDGNKQCKLEYGPNHSYYTRMAYDCRNLKCVTPNGAEYEISIYPPAHGTWCANHKWCIHARCVADGTTPAPPIDGDWSQWGSYNDCNRDCGGAVQSRSRSCTNPIPQNGGKTCFGIAMSHWKTCNMFDCPINTKTWRQEQCLSINKDFLPIIDKSSPCKLLCGNSISGYYYYGSTKDGTLCYDGEKKDICIESRCRQVGCDLNLESGVIKDRCGICGANGSSCIRVSASDNNPYKVFGQHEITTIPKGAVNIKVEEVAGSYNFLGVKVGSSNEFAYRLPNWSWTGQVAGTTLHYLMEDYYFPDKIEIPGKINDQIKIFLVNVYVDVTKGIKWLYYIKTASSSTNTSTQVKTAFEWVLGSWGSCSKTCAGGIQSRTIGCRREDDLTLVSTTFCPVQIKPNLTQSCNTGPCPEQWHISTWGPCSKSCGNGTKYRNITCSQLHSDGKYYVSTTAICDANQKPQVIASQSCNAVICLAVWELGDWSQCSTSCGPGKRQKAVTCKRTNADGSIFTVKDLECSLVPKPIAVADCNLDLECPQWKVVYSQCPVTCGGGYEYPSVVCVQPGNEVKLNDSMCSSGSKLNISIYEPKSCNTQYCHFYEWRTKDGTCSVSCGQGVIPVSVFCVRGNDTNDNKTVNDRFCEAVEKPTITSKPCEAGECPERFIWNVTYSACSVTCGNGTRDPRIACIRQKNMAKAGDESCDVSQKPSPPTVPCFLQTCYVWKVGYGSCSVTCGKGIKVVSIVCIRDKDKLVMADSYCISGEKPTAAKNMTCNLEECMFKWNVTYGYCVTTCGSGYRLRLLKCINTATGLEVIKSSCSGIEFPDQKSCSVGPCKPAMETTSDFPKFYSVGCFKDSYPSRTLSDYLGNYRDFIDWSDMSKTINACAKAAHNKMKKLFAIQYYGECWGGDGEAANKYYVNGETNNCWEGVGKRLTNYVYHFKTPLPTRALAPAVEIGCFNDNHGYKRPLPRLIGDYRSEISNWKDMSKIVARCAFAVARQTYSYFGIEYYGECWSGKDGKSTYNIDGVADVNTRCYLGVGREAAYYVYAFITSV